jgi:hypothetical protein
MLRRPEPLRGPAVPTPIAAHVASDESDMCEHMTRQRHAPAFTGANAWSVVIRRVNGARR